MQAGVESIFFCVTSKVNVFGCGWLIDMPGIHGSPG